MDVGDVFAVGDEKKILRVVYALPDDDEVLMVQVSRKVLYDWIATAAEDRRPTSLPLQAWDRAEVEQWDDARDDDRAVARQFVFGEPTLSILPVVARTAA